MYGARFKVQGGVRPSLHPSIISLNPHPNKKGCGTLASFEAAGEFHAVGRKIYIFFKMVYRSCAKGAVCIRHKRGLRLLERFFQIRNGELTMKSRKNCRRGNLDISKEAP